MRSEEFSAKSIEDALKLGLDSFGLEACDVTYEVLEQPSKGFLGFGGKNARIKITEKYSAERVGTNFLKQIFADMELAADVKVTKKDEYYLFEIVGENLGILIGRRGDTLDALQFLLNLVLNKESDEKIKGILDVENYREKREETLEHLGIKLAERARRTGQRVVLEPMNPQERRIIHMVLQDDKTVSTFSEGEEPYRKVIIVPKKKHRPTHYNSNKNGYYNRNHGYKRDYNKADKSESETVEKSYGYDAVDEAE